MKSTDKEILVSAAAPSDSSNGQSGLSASPGAQKRSKGRTITRTVARKKTATVAKKKVTTRSVMAKKSTPKRAKNATKKSTAKTIVAARKAPKRAASTPVRSKASQLTPTGRVKNTMTPATRKALLAAKRALVSAKRAARRAATAAQTAILCAERMIQEALMVAKTVKRSNSVAGKNQSRPATRITAKPQSRAKSYAPLYARRATRKNSRRRA